MCTFVRTFDGATERFAIATKFERIAVRVGFDVSVISCDADRRILVREDVQAIDAFDKLV